LCLSRGEPVGFSRQSCSAVEYCDGFLRSEYLSELQRYYVPEARATEAEQTLRSAAAEGQAKLVVALDPNGKPHIKELRVAGKPLLP
jgi:hypothetical protein